MEEENRQGLIRKFQTLISKSSWKTSKDKTDPQICFSLILLLLNLQSLLSPTSALRWSKCSIYAGFHFFSVTMCYLVPSLDWLHGVGRAGAQLGAFVMSFWRSASDWRISRYFQRELLRISIWYFSLSRKEKRPRKEPVTREILRNGRGVKARRASRLLQRSFW